MKINYQKLIKIVIMTTVILTLVTACGGGFTGNPAIFN
jgi:hypothetical protein